MKTRTWKSRFVFLLGVLVILLPFGQSLATGITAIAVTLEKEETAQELFDNEYGNGKITYTREGDSINWELAVTKTVQDNPTQFVATLKNADGIVMPQLSKNDQFKVSDDSSSQDYGKILQKDASAKEQKETIKFTTASLDKATLTVAFLDEEGTKALYEKDITIEIPASEEAATEPEASTESSTEATVASSDSSVATETTDSATQTSGSTDAASVDSSSTESSDVTDLGDADEATVDSAKKEAEKKYEETGRPQVITRSAADSLVFSGRTYANIEPQYITDNSGTYPEYSWIPNGNTNVINHQGNVGGGTSWDKLTSWNGDPTNLENSYIEYGGTGADADFAIRKYAVESAGNPGLFDVYLNVRGNVMKNINPIDVMLVVDWSGSMMKNDRIQNVQEGVKLFVETLKKGGITNQINLGYIGYSSEGSKYSNGKIGLAPFNEVANQIEQFTPSRVSGGTFTQKALRDADTELSKKNPDHKKVIVLLTDGVPTYSYKVNKVKTTTGRGVLYYGTGFTNVVEGTGSTSKISGNETATDENGVKRDIDNTFIATVGEAMRIKEKNIEIHGLGIQLQDDATAELSSVDVANRMKQIVSKNNSGEFFYEEAKQSEDIATYLSTKAVQIISTVNSGEIVDPLGGQFTYQPETLNLKSVGEITAILPKEYKQPFDGTLTISNLNLGKGQEVQVHYQVRIQTENPDFIPEYWYPLNGRTTFLPNKENDKDIVDFGVPSAKAPGTTIDLTKKWDEFDNNILGRSDLLFQVSRNEIPMGFLKITSQNEKSNDKNTWSRIGVQKISAADSPYSETIWLPKFDNQGNDFKYAISKELTELTNYESTKIDDNTWKNTKIFTPLSLKITKKDSITGSLLKGAEFAISGGDLSESTLLESIGDGTYVLPKNITLNKGKVYEVREAKSPEGYRMLNDPIRIEIDATGKVSISNKELSNANLTVSDNVITFDVPNKPKVPLPSTGGSGTWMYYLAGSLALVVVGGYLFYRSRNSKGVA